MSKIEFRNLNPNRKFKGIWIPEYLWFYEGLTINEKVFYLEIDSLDNEQGCFASNEHFSKFSGLSKNRCSEVIKSLESKRIVTVELIYKLKAGKISKEVDKRIIKVNPEWERNLRTEYERQYDEYRNMINARKESKEPIINEEEKPSSDPIRKIEGGVFEKSKGVFEKSTALFEKSKDSNTILDIQDSNTDDDDTEKENQSSSPTTINDNLIETVKETWLEVTGKRLILSNSSKIKLTDLAEHYGEEEVINAIEQINNSDYLKEKITLTHFIKNFEKIAMGEYANHAQNSVNMNGVSDKVSGFNSLGDNGRTWDFDEIQELENKRIDMLLNAQ